jgi:hypothetical protein
VRKLLPFSLFLFATLAAAPAAAQQRSSVRGLQVGAHLSGVGIELAADPDDEEDTGGGVGIRVGWGVSEVVVLYAQLDGADVDGDDDALGAGGGDTFSLAHLDLGARFHFGAGRRRLVPYLDAAVGGALLRDDTDAGDVTLSGTVVSFGGGVQYFVSRALALDGSVKLSVGELKDVDIDGESDELDDPLELTTSRINLGVTWYP